MLTKVRWTTLGLWLMASCLAALSCSLIRPAAHIGAQWFPIGNDSFYHAVRILAAAHDPSSFYEFDPKIHAPEGSLLVWPWGYDFVIAKIVRLGVALGLSADPLTIMSWTPVGAVFLGVGLLMLVAHRVSLGTWPMTLAALCMALSATTQNLYGYAQIDHHYAEHIFILATLAAGLAWFKAPSRSSGLLLGAAFGLALAVHNALFILPIPFLATALIQWLQGKQLPREPAVAFAISLLAAALAVMLPSQSFQEFRFEFYTLSWFHLYIVCSTALVALLLAILPPNRRSMLAMTAIGVVLLLPLAGQIRYAQSFVSGSLGMLADILEMRSPIKLALDGEEQFISGFYSLLGWLSPITFGLCVYRAWRERLEPRLLFWISCVLGLALMSTQLRMHYFGGFATYLPWLIVAQEYAVARPDLYKRAWLTVSLLLVLAYAPVIRHALVAPVPKAADEWFDNLYPVFQTLHKACAEDPGIVLADSNAGHYIRYFTDCSVIANNFLLTEQQFAKVDEVRRLFSLPADELRTRAPYVKYVLARAGNIKPGRDGHFLFTFFGDATRLPQTLLLGPQSEVPPEFQLLFQANVYAQSGTLQNIPYAKLYKVQRPAPTPSVAAPTQASANEVGE